VFTGPRFRPRVRDSQLVVGTCPVAARQFRTADSNFGDRVIHRISSLGHPTHVRPERCLNVTRRKNRARVPGRPRRLPDRPRREGHAARGWPKPLRGISYHRVCSEATRFPADCEPSEIGGVGDRVNWRESNREKRLRGLWEGGNSGEAAGALASTGAYREWQKAGTQSPSHSSRETPA